MKEEIFELLKMKNSLYEVEKSVLENYAYGHNKNGEIVDGFPIYPYHAASGLWTTPTDLALLVIELIQSLKGKGKLGISSGKCEEMVCSQGNTEWSGLGLFLNHTAQEVEISSLGCGVGYQCMLVAYPY